MLQRSEVQRLESIVAKRTIEIDEDVFAHLQSHSEPLVDTPNDVLRRLFFGDSGEGEPGPTSKPGALAAILRCGLIKPGDRLQHHQPRRGQTHEATVTAEGGIELPNGQRFAKPSPALKHQTGTPINGWEYVHVASGRSLADLRREADSR
jgi:hypothetical protein